MAKPITIQQEVAFDDGGPGGTVQARRWSVTQRAGTLPRTFSLETAGTPPADIETFTIRVGMNGSTLVPLIVDAVPRVQAGEWRQGEYGTSITGSDGAERIVNLAPSKTLIFLAREFIDKAAKGYEWRLNSDTQRIEGYMEYQGHTFSWPLRIDEIPKETEKDGTFTTVVVENCRDEILLYLAQELGIGLHNGTPRTPFRGAYVIEDSRTYFDAFRDLTSVWNPLLAMQNEQGAWALYILDVEDVQEAPYDFTLQQHMLTVYGIQRSNEDLVNLCTVTGAAKDDPQTPSALFMPPRAREPMEMDVTYTVEREIATDPATGKELPNCPTWVDHNLTRITKEYAQDPADAYNRILVRETVLVFGSWEGGENLVSKRITEYRYLDYTAAVAEDQEEWQRVILPGTTLPTFTKVRTRKTNYGDYVDFCGEVERLETEEGFCVYDWSEVGGQGMRLNPQEIDIANKNKTIDLNTISGQSFLWTTIRRKHIRYETEDYQRVRRDTITWNNLDGSVDTDTEYIPIDYKQRPNKGKSIPASTWKYEDQTSIALSGRRPRVQISVPDLKEGEDDELANELWERVKRKSGAEQIEARVGLPIWLPVLIGQRLSIQAAEFEEWDPEAAAFTARTLPGGSYYVTGTQHSYDFSGDQARLVTALTIKSAY